MRFTVVEFDTPPLVPVTTTDAFCTLAMLAPAWIVRLVDEVELGGLKLQVAPVGSPEEQLKTTVPLKAFCGVTVIVALLLLVPTAAVRAVVLGERVKPGCVAIAFHALARLLASTEPRPVTRL